VLIVLQQFINAHFNSQHIQLIATNHFATQLCQVALILVGETGKQVIGNNEAKHGIAQKLKALVAQVGFRGKRAVHKGQMIKLHIGWVKTRKMINALRKLVIAGEETGYQVSCKLSQD
jgi:hypothetical protein